MLNLDQEKRLTFKSVAWILILIGVCPINPLVGVGLMFSFWVMFH